MYYAYQASDSPFPTPVKSRRQADEELPPLDPFVTDATKNGRPEVVLLPAPLIYPYSWDTSDHLARCVCSAETVFFDTEVCKRVTPGGYVVRDLRGSSVQLLMKTQISYWSHSWGGWKFGKKLMEYTPWGKPKVSASVAYGLLPSHPIAGASALLDVASGAPHAAVNYLLIYRHGTTVAP